MNPPYRNLYFGMSDALNEANEHPAEFVKSYVDLNNVSNEVLEGQKFLVLGPKGYRKDCLVSIPPGNSSQWHSCSPGT